MALMRRTAVSMLLPILIAACSGSSSITQPNSSPIDRDLAALVADVYDSFDSGEMAEGMAALDELVSEFGESSDPDVASVVARTLYNTGTLLYQAGRFDAALAPYEDLVFLFSNSTDPEVLSDVADGLFNQGLVFHELGRHQEELASFEKIDQFHDATDPYMASLVGRALNNRGVTLNEMNRSLEEQLAVYDTVLARYGGSTDPGILPNVARALFQKGFVLAELGMNAEARSAYEELTARFGDTADPYIARFVDATQQELDKQA